MMEIKEEKEEIIVDIKQLPIHADDQECLQSVDNKIEIKFEEHENDPLKVEEQNVIDLKTPLNITIKEEEEISITQEEILIKEEEIINYDPPEANQPHKSSSKIISTSQNFKFECSECHRKFVKAHNLNVHRCKINSKSNPKLIPKICDFCNRSFVHKSKLKLHIMEKHTNTPKTFSCEQCSKSYALRINLLSHLGEHRRNKNQDKIVCSICDKEVKVVGLRKHIRRVHGVTKEMKDTKSDRPFKCQKCPKSFMRMEILRQHEAIHEKKFKCEKCKKSFALKVSYEDHLKAHENLKTFKCGKCEKAFNTRKGLTQHGLTHIETMNFKCDGCEKLFKTLTYLNNHKKFCKARKK